MTRHRAGRVRAAALTAVALVGAACHPTPRPSPAPAAGRVILPPGYDPGHAYPVVELLPPTGNTAEALLQIYLSEVGLGRLYREPPERQLEALWPYLAPGRDHAGRGFVLILARGRGRAADYRTAGAWARTIERYERQVLADVRALAARRRVDASRVVVAGFSLGGDLAWAIALRNADELHGAIVMASRASYRPTPDDARALRERGSRFFLTMGDRDSGTRRRLARAAAAQLERWGVRHQFKMIPHAGHAPAPIEAFAQALDYVLSP
jgi:predicted esterase